MWMQSFCRVCVYPICIRCNYWAYIYIYTFYSDYIVDLLLCKYIVDY